MTEPTYATYPSLRDRAVFITGGADGIGRALVEEFARQGSSVAFADRNVEKAEAVVDACAALKVATLPRFYAVDLVDVAALKDVCASARADLGTITVLVKQCGQRRSP